MGKTIREDPLQLMVLIRDRGGPYRVILKVWVTMVHSDEIQKTKT